MAVSFVKFQSFVEAVAHKKHNLSTDQLVIALTNAANPPVNTNSVLANLTQISYTNLSTRNCTTAGSAQVGGTYRLTITDLILTASGGSVAPFQYIVLYNDTAANDELIGYYNPGSQLTLNSGDTLTLDFDGTNGVIQLT